MKAYKRTLFYRIYLMLYSKTMKISINKNTKRHIN